MNLFSFILNPTVRRRNWFQRINLFTYINILFSKVSLVHIGVLVMFVLGHARDTLWIEKAQNCDVKDDEDMENLVSGS